MKDVVIVSGKRTPIGKINGQLTNFSAADLGTISARAVIEDSGINPKDIDQVIFGNAIQAGNGQNIARQIELRANIPEGKTACTVNQVCGSGMKAIRMGQAAIAMGDCEVALVGGTESMSNAPFLNKQQRKGHKFGSISLLDSIQNDGLNDFKTGLPMGITAENVAAKYKISREDQDLFSLRSHQKATRAIRNHYFKKEIISIPVRKGLDYIEINNDETVRPKTSLKKLAGLKPAFKKNGTVTAGNSASLNDGASALLLMSQKKAKELHLKPIAKIDGYAEAGFQPDLMGYAPVFAVRKLLEQSNEAIEDFDLFELNEAFASQSLAVMRALNLPEELLNICGGAIAMGHPLGDSGSRIVITLIDNLKRTHQHHGLATLCIGGGMGMAMSISLL